MDGDLGLEQRHLLQTERTFGKNSSLREQGPEFLALLHARVMSALAACILLDMREVTSLRWDPLGLPAVIQGERGAGKHEQAIMEAQVSVLKKERLEEGLGHCGK